jgi:hypothetical protein
MSESPWMRIAGAWPGDETDAEINELLYITNERKNITQPADWWAAWKTAADDEGKSLSAWIGEQCNAALKSKTQKQLSERGKRGRPTAK